MENYLLLSQLISLLPLLVLSLADGGQVSALSDLNGFVLNSNPPRLSVKWWGEKSCKCQSKLQH